LTGASGQLASDLKIHLKHHDLLPFSHAELDITDAARLNEVLERMRPDLLINTSAYHRVDECESNMEKSFEVNAFAVKRLGELCRKLGAGVMHFSTDYVFGGERSVPYTEDDAPGPLSVYGASKLAGEYLLRNALESHYVVRTCGLFGVAGSSGKGGNFIETMMKLAREGKSIRVVSDQVLTPTSTTDLAKKCAELIETGRFGLYHITSDGECSWFEFAQTIFALAGLEADLKATTSREFGAPARRPRYSVLENRRLKELLLDDLRPWRAALTEYMERKGYLKP
jgi:dTDP-4-dehydrorhamnose reductase